MTDTGDAPVSTDDVPSTALKTVEVPGTLVAAARELLVRTAELPRTKRELFAVLSEYRAAVHAFAVGTDGA
jgi:hypothetical protein